MVGKRQCQASAWRTEQALTPAARARAPRMSERRRSDTPRGPLRSFRGGGGPERGPQRPGPSRDWEPRRLTSRVRPRLARPVADRAPGWGARSARGLGLLRPLPSKRGSPRRGTTRRLQAGAGCGLGSGRLRPTGSRVRSFRGLVVKKSQSARGCVKPGFGRFWVILGDLTRVWADLLHRS